MSSTFDPFWLFRMPLSGNVAQSILSPAITVNYAGDASVEERIASDVASNGKQIGWLNEIVLALAEQRQPDPHTVARLAQAIKDIEDIKQRMKKSALGNAVDALDQLQTEAPDAYRFLIDARSLPVSALETRLDELALAAK
jgi:hypothetical protein